MKTKSKANIVVLIIIALLILGPYLHWARAKEIVKEEPPGPKPQGTLIAARVSLEAESFLPWVGTGGQCDFWEPIYEYLFYNNLKTEERIPGLALRTKYSKDYRSLTLWLRAGVQWHDGWGEVTAEDVKYTFERIMGKESVNIVAGLFRRAIESIEVVDRYTLVFHLSTPDPLFFLNFNALDMPYVVILCKKYIETVGDEKANHHPIGSGPYRLVEHKWGESLKFEALEQHWRVVPEFKYLIMRAVPEPSTRIAMIRTGKIDIASFPADKIAELQKAGVSVVTSPGGYVVNLNFGGMCVPEDERYKEGYHQKDPWTDRRVREAMNIAIDREAIVKTIYRGVAKATSIWPQIPGRDEVKGYPYDPERAKRLLAEAGFPKGFGFKLQSLAMSPGAEMPMVNEALSGYWSAIGLTPKIVMTTWSSWRPHAKNAENAGSIWTMRTTCVPEWSWTSKVRSYHQIKSKGGTLTYFQNPELLALLEKRDAEDDLKKMEIIWREIAKLMHDDYITIPIAVVDTVFGRSKKVGEWLPASKPWFLAYVRHTDPLNTYRLFELE